MVLVRTPSPPPHAKACVSRNCDTNARIKFIFDTAIDDLEWKNPIDFGENWINQNGGHFVKIWWKSLCTLWLNQKCTDQLHIWCSHWHTIEGGPYQFVAYWSKMVRNAIESDFQSSKMAGGGYFAKKSGCRSSKMAIGGHFAKKIQRK